MKTRVLPLLLALLFSHYLSAEPLRPGLELTQSDGTTVTYCLEQLPQLTFQNDSLVVRIGEHTDRYGHASVASLRYVSQPEPSTSLEHHSADSAPAVTFFDHSFSIVTPEAVTLAVYTLSGRCLWQHTSEAHSQFRMEYAHLTPGVYILQCGSHTYKFLVR